MSGSVARFRTVVSALALLVLSSCGGPTAPLDRVERIAALPLGARGQPVHLTGWVTLADPTLNAAFIEDKTGAARVDLPFMPLVLVPGNRVDVTGTVSAGGSNPSVAATKVGVLEGNRELRPLPVRIADLAAGRAALRYSEFEGILRSQYFNRAGRLEVRIGAEGAAIDAQCIDTTDLPNLAAPGARVRVRAVSSVSRDAYGNIGRVQLWVPRSADFALLEAAPAAIPVQTVREIASLPRGSLPAGMLRLRGSLQRGLRDGFALTDPSGSIRLIPAPNAALPAGDDIDVFGFAEEAGGQVQLADATLFPKSPEHRPAGDRPELTSISQVHALSAEEAGRAIPVHLRATVTYFNPDGGMLFLQDETGGTYAFAPRGRELKLAPGDLADVTGVSAPGDFAPIVSNAWATRLSASSMPSPSPAHFDDLFSGKEDSVWVQAEGIVQSAEAANRSESRIWMQWGTHRYPVIVLDRQPGKLPPADAHVRLQGVCTTIFNTRRQILGIQVYVPAAAFLHIVELPRDPATLKPHPIDDLLRFSAAEEPGRRTLIRGIVALITPTGPSYVRDATAGLKIRNHAPSDVKPGDVVDVLGFAHAGEYSAEMQDALISRVQGGPPPAAAPMTADEALDGGHDAELVRIDALLVDEIASQRRFVLQAGGKHFSAVLDSGEMPGLVLGSILRLTGICNIESTESLSHRVPKSFTLFLRGPEDISVVRSAPFFTAGRLLGVLGSMVALLLVVLAWVAVLRRRVGLQTAVIGKKLEQEASLKEAAEQASRVKSEFLANMSHEIRTPLNGILGFAALMSGSQLSGEQRENNDAVRSSAESLLSIVNNILDLSRIEAGRLDLEATDFSVRDCVESAVRLARPLAAAKGLDLSLDIDTGAAGWLRGDPQRLRQILLNLTGNAIKFTERGAVGVRVSASGESAGGGAGPEADRGLHELQFAVSDSGIGIPPPQQALIFQPFCQADGSITRRFGGTGLGLTISRKLVDMMGGKIWLESREGQGSTFFFTVALPGAATPASTAERLPSPGRPAHPGFSILVAEDNEINQRLIRRLLVSRGHRVTIAGNGAEALEAWRRSRFDLILMDVQMPVLDGLGAARRIRAEEAAGDSHIPIVAMTANAMKGDREKCLEAGMDSYISKPIEIEALDRALDRCNPLSIEPA